MYLIFSGFNKMKQKKLVQAVCVFEVLMSRVRDTQAHRYPE